MNFLVMKNYCQRRLEYQLSNERNRSERSKITQTTNVFNFIITL